jgi:hypothetical protein
MDCSVPIPQQVKGAKRLGTRLGNCLTSAQGRRLLEGPDKQATKGKRDHASWLFLWAAYQSFRDGLCIF